MKIVSDINIISVLISQLLFIFVVFQVSVSVQLTSYFGYCYISLIFQVHVRLQ